MGRRMPGKILIFFSFLFLLIFYSVAGAQDSLFITGRDLLTFFPDIESGQKLVPDFIERLFGPTNINAALGNGRMAVGVANTGTVTVLKWPRPSYHDQLRYRTVSRDLPQMGARENDGIFFGLLFRDPGRCLWLRDASSIEQKYLSDLVNILQTTYRFEDQGLEVRVIDFVPDDHDALIRQVIVQSEAGTREEMPSEVVAFVNLSICQKKIPYVPVADWLFDSWGQDELAFQKKDHLLLQNGHSFGINQDPVLAAVGFWRASCGHQCGRDGLGAEGGEEAFQDAADGVLSGVRKAVGQVDGALAISLEFDTQGEADADFFILFGEQYDKVIDAVQRLRAAEAAELRTVAGIRDQNWLAAACIPDTDDEDLLAVLRRALLLTKVVRDERSGAFSCSVATQPPYALDWSRDGAYINLMLDRAGYLDWVTKHNLFYAEVQRWPLGNWDMCTYGDGVAGGPLFLELDTMGLTAWALWDHYRNLPAEQRAAYLNEVYPAIAKTADFFVFWRDPETLLPLPAFESDFPNITSTLLSAEMAWLSLRTAINAGELMGESYIRLADWRERKRELKKAIFKFYFNEEEQHFEGDPLTLAYLVYPVAFLPVEDQRVQNTADQVYQWLEPIVLGQTDGGSYLGLAAISLARAWQGQAEKLAKVEAVLDFLVDEIPTPGTHHYGECFVTLPDGYDTRTGIPHPMTAALTYLTAAEIYGVSCPPEGDDDDAADDDLVDDDLIDDDVADDDLTFDTDDDDDDDEQGCGSGI